MAVVALSAAAQAPSTPSAAASARTVYHTVAATATPTSSSPASATNYGEPPASQLGGAGITPHLNLKVGAATTAALYTPTYTTADALAYAGTTPVFHMPSAGGTQTAVKATFTTWLGAGQTVGDDHSMPYPSEPVCVVEIHGQFEALPPPGSKQAAYVYTIVYVVYDAKTGNVLTVYAPGWAVIPQPGMVNIPAKPAAINFPAMP